MQPIILIGYSGHAFVAGDIVLRMGRSLAGYCDRERKDLNPFGVPYFGPETSSGALERLRSSDYFVAVGDNGGRRAVCQKLGDLEIHPPVTLVHPTSTRGFGVELGTGVMVAGHAILNPMTIIEDGAICNTACVIEHECRIGAFSHIAPGAVLAGNVTVGAGALVGAGAVVKKGTTIGANAIVGAGAVVIRDVPDGVTVVGNPARPK